MMILPPMLQKWLQETLFRLLKKSPKYMMAWNIIMLSLMGITWIPEVLDWFNVELPMLFAAKLNKAVGWASTGFFIATQLSASSTAVAKTEDVTILKTTDEKSLPFTAAQEQNKEENKEEKLPEIPTEMIDKPKT
jgi:hypothetical protein